MSENKKDMTSEYRRVSDIFSGLSEHYTPQEFRFKAPVKKRVLDGKASVALEKNEQDIFTSVKRVTKYTPISGKNVFAGFLIMFLVAAAIFGVLAVPEIMYRDDYNEAMTMYKNGQYSAAVSKLSELGNFRDSTEMVYKIKYDWASSHFSLGEYKEAMELFSSIVGYEDSYERYRESTYLYAGELYSDAQFDEAVRLYETILDYKDVSEKLAETVYENAFNAFMSADYERAIRLFSALEDNEDAKQFAIISKAYLMNEAGNADPDEVSTIMANLGVMDSDVARLALELELFTAEKLSGTWKSEDGKYSVMVDRAKKKLEIVMPIGYTGSEFKIEDDIIYVRNEEGGWNACLLIYQFNPNNVSQPKAVILYNYYDSKYYTLYRK